MECEVLQCDLRPESLARNLIRFMQQVSMEMSIVNEYDHGNHKQQENNPDGPGDP
jgi:hypothetical protein